MSVSCRHLGRKAKQFVPLFGQSRTLCYSSSSLFSSRCVNKQHNQSELATVVNTNRTITSRRSYTTPSANSTGEKSSHLLKYLSAAAVLLAIFYFSTRTTVAGDLQHVAPQPTLDALIVDAPHHSPPSSEDGETHPNPFLCETAPLSLYEKVKLFFAALTIFPLRVALLIPCALLAAFLARLSIVGLSEEEVRKPLSRWRKRLFLAPFQLTMRFMLFIVGFYYIPVKKPANGKTDSAPILVANHVSFIEPFYLVAANLPRVIAKKDTRDIPLIGDGIVAMRSILVDRDAKDSRRDTLEQIAKHTDDFYSSASAPDQYQQQLLIFPEGTTTNGKALITFKKGAFAAGSSVQPVVVKFPYKHFDPTWVPNSPSGVFLFFRLLCQFVNHMEVEYLDVYEPSVEEKKDPDLFANNVRKVMAKALDVPTTTHSYEDMILLCDALKLKVPPLAINLRAADMLNSHKLSLREIKELLNRFSSADVDKNGRIDMAEFAASLGVPASDHTASLFRSFDTDGSDDLCFKEYVLGLAVTSKNFKPNATKSLFQVLDIDGDGHISKEEMKTNLELLWGHSISNAQIDNLFRILSSGNHGAVDWNNFVLFVQKHPEYVQLLDTAFVSRRNS